MSIGKRIDKMIRLLNISNEEARGDMKISRQSLYNILHGTSKNPSIEALVNWKIARPEINLNWLMAGIGDPILSGKDRELSVRGLATLAARFPAL